MKTSATHLVCFDSCLTLELYQSKCFLFSDHFQCSSLFVERRNEISWVPTRKRLAGKKDWMPVCFFSSCFFPFSSFRGGEERKGGKWRKEGDKKWDIAILFIYIVIVKSVFQSQVFRSLNFVFILLIKTFVATGCCPVQWSEQWLNIHLHSCQVPKTNICFLLRGRK